ncbi:MAG TPA: hypothetical protein VIR27_19635 [Mycobacteriales bacterium]
MTSPGEANVVPIALVLDGRTGYTIWAAPWVEDGEEWQAFLGAGSRVFVFEDLDDLATFLGSGSENDLSDHPSWTMLTTLPAEQLAPEQDYHFDLDEVPGLTHTDPDDEVVMRVGDTVDMVQRIAECCDDGPLLNLLESPAFAALLDEESALEAGSDSEDATDGEDAEITEGGSGTAAAADTAADHGDTDGLEEDADDPWAEIGEAVRTAWPLVTKRVNACLHWFAPGEQPERVVPDRTDESPAGDNAELTEPDTTGTTGTTGADDEPDEKTARFWAEVGIAPTLLITSAGVGYTLRCYLDDEARFLGVDQHIEMFRSAAGLEEFARADNEHDLAELDTWPQVRGAESLSVTPAAEDCYDLGAAEAQLHAGPAGADPVVLRRASEFLLDAAEYCDLVGVTEALADDAPLGQAIGAVLRSATGSMFSQTWNGAEAAALWREAVTEVESALRWND